MSLTVPIIGLHFMRHNCVVVETTHGLFHFPHLTMQVKIAGTEVSAKPQAVLIDDAPTTPPMTTKTITAFVDPPSERNTTGPLTPFENFSKTVILVIPHSMSTILDHKVAVRVTNTTESTYRIRKHKQIAVFSVVTPEQSKFNIPVETALLSTITQGDLDPTTYFIELLRTN